MSSDVPISKTSDYERFRGRCKELSEAACKDDPSLRLVRGFYHCPIWGKQTHWWCEKPDGTVIDPTARQFPSKGIGDYVETDGNVECAQCGKQMYETDAWRIEGRYAYCSYACYGRFVGVA